MNHSRSRRAWLRTTVAIGALGSLVLAGCSSSPSADGDSNGSSGDNEVKELVIPTNTSPWTDSYKKIIADYEDETGVKVTLKTYPFDGLKTKQVNDVQNQSHTFDLYQIVEADTAKFYENDWVKKLTDVDPDFEWPENVIHFAGIGEWNAEDRRTEEGGEPYALPIMGIIQEFMYRKDVYDDLGLQVPETWDEVIDNAKKAMDSGEVKYGYTLRLKPPSFDFTSYLHSYGGDWFDDNWEPALDTPEAKKALDTFIELAKLGPDSPQTMGQAEETALMQGGTVLQANLVSSVATALEDPNLSSVVDKMGYAVLPGHTPQSGAWALAIPAGLSDARTQAAYDFMKWITSKEAQQKWTEYGGMPVRSDIESDEPQIQMLAESEKYLQSPPRYPFTSEMYETTDRYLSEAVAGQISEEKALDAMQKELRKLAVKAGYLDK